MHDGASGRHPVEIASGLGPASHTLDMSATLRRCPDVSLALGRCGFTSGHAVPHGKAEAQDGQLRCLRWDDTTEWLELPSDTGEMARVRLPWAAEYQFPDLVGDPAAPAG
jgi:hypothetical protein